MSDYTATIYTRPGCMKCHVTARKIKKLGIEPTMLQLDDHPEKITLMQNNGWSALPLVEVQTPEGETFRWSDLSINDIDALAYNMSVPA